MKDFRPSEPIEKVNPSAGKKLLSISNWLKKKVFSVKITLPIFLPGLGCGVLGMVYSKRSVKLGEIASKLLQKLEYRGYDSTGLCIQDKGQKITLRKAIGAPSQVVQELEFETLAGKLFCGQVRWATFGAVDSINAQPHLVKCKTSIYGAHNGNITNTQYLKEDLILEGHKVLSDNDGEMLVHTVEHFFFLNLEKYTDDEKKNLSKRRSAMIKAIRDASKKVKGSYAAIIVDPVSEEVFAIKSGSSLYVGKGRDENGDFILASSDLSAVLSKTRTLIPLSEGEFINFSSNDWTVYSLEQLDLKEKRQLRRSKLRNRDTALIPPFKYFMEQEIANQVEASRELIHLFIKDEISKQALFRHYDKYVDKVFKLRQSVRITGFETDTNKLLKAIKGIFESEDFRSLQKELSLSGTFDKYLSQIDPSRPFNSIEEGLLQDIHRLSGGKWKKELILVDTFFLYKHRYSLRKWVTKFASKLELHRNGRIFIVACGSSYNAAKIGAIFLNKIASIPVQCLLPGEFRSQVLESITDDDLFIGVSQSGETKDLVDICNALNNRVKALRLMIVNNVNSTLAQEKCDFYLPILCGPEIAVPATKSFTNQVVLFFGLALKCLELRCNNDNTLAELKAQFGRIPDLLDETYRTLKVPISELAGEIFLSPSIHILATANIGLAREGALKIREVVLNHAEGMEASEFKHGPNTILGKNFTFGMDQLLKVISSVTTIILESVRKAQSKGLNGTSISKLIEATTEILGRNSRPFNLTPEENNILDNVLQKNFYSSLFNRYPLIFLTPPTQRDTDLTISQINTHKIRGASIYVIAEESESLRKATTTPPGEDSDYRSYFLTLPRTGSEYLYPFSAIMALQLLALEMSIKKMKFLNRLHIPLHGVHPDVPKNVSKSITVD